MAKEEIERQKLHGPRRERDKKKWRWWRIGLDVFTGVLILCACCVCANLGYLNWNFSEPFFVNGMSMYPTLNADGKRKTADGYRPLTWNDSASVDGDIVDYGYAKIGDKGHWRDGLTRMDVVVTYYAEDYVINGNEYTLKPGVSPKIKRLIGLPKETLTFDVVSRGQDEKGFYEYVGDSARSYVDSYEETWNPAWGKTTIAQPSGESEVLKPLYDESDFPDVNGQSYPNAQLPGGLRSKTWTLEEDEYFLMGDNRGGTGHSMDSREKGPVKGFMIIGKAFLISSQRKLSVQSDSTLKANFSLGLAWWPWDYIHLDRH